MYKKGRENNAADALSRREEEEYQLALSVITFPHLNWLMDLRTSYSADPEILKLLTKVQSGIVNEPKFTIRNEILLRKRRIYLCKTFKLKQQILQHIHDSSSVGHSGYHKTLERAKADFY